MPDLIYERPEGRRSYLSTAKHQFNAQNEHAKWISINIERDLFDYADYGNYQKEPDTNIGWICISGNMFSLQQDRSSVGRDMEQFGFFQAPANPQGEWHGFPIIPFSKSRYNISDELLEQWVNEGIIEEDEVSMIIKKKRI